MPRAIAVGRACFSGKGRPGKPRAADVLEDRQHIARRCGSLCQDGDRGDEETARRSRGEAGRDRKDQRCESYFINQYSASEKYPRIERVAYVQMPKAVAYIVFSCDGEKALRKHQ